MPPPPSQRSAATSYGNLAPSNAQAQYGSTPSSPYSDGSPRQVVQVASAGLRNAGQQRMGFSASPTAGDMWTGNKAANQAPPQAVPRFVARLVVDQRESDSFAVANRTSLRPSSAGAVPNGPSGRPLGVIPPLSSAALNPERPHSNTSLSSSDSGPGSTVSSSRSSSRDPLPALSSIGSLSSLPPTVLTTSAPPTYNGQLPTAKPPYGTRPARSPSSTR